ncbi:MAG: hypothetical protein M5U34_16165 [Chloroflexi bacterium]|nr:hypothetical protein [Chloroflexota bacterium]
MILQGELLAVMGPSRLETEDAVLGFGFSPHGAASLKASVCFQNSENFVLLFDEVWFVCYVVEGHSFSILVWDGLILD